VEREARAGINHFHFGLIDFFALKGLMYRILLNVMLLFVKRIHPYQKHLFRDRSKETQLQKCFRHISISMQP